MKNETRIVDIHKKKGKRPDFDVYIGRKTKTKSNKFCYSSKWCNPYPIKEFGLYRSLELYKKRIKKLIKFHPKKYNLKELYGKRLGCWCVNTSKTNPKVCHGQILLELIKKK